MADQSRRGDRVAEGLKALKACEDKVAALEKRLEALETRLDQVDMDYDKRFDGIDTRLDEIETHYERRIYALEKRLQSVDTHIEGIDISMNRIRYQMHKFASALQASAEYMQ